MPVAAPLEMEISLASDCAVYVRGNRSGTKHKGATDRPVLPACNAPVLIGRSGLMFREQIRPVRSLSAGRRANVLGCKKRASVTWDAGPLSFSASGDLVGRG